MASSPDQQSSSVPLPWTVAIGASGSTGLSSIISVLATLSPKIDAVVLVVLHRPFDHPSKLREVLSGATAMPVIVAEQGEQFERGHCYIGEPSAHLTLAERSFGGLTNDPDAAHRGRTVDLLFQSHYDGPIDCIGSPQQIAEAINWVTRPRQSSPRSKPKFTSQEQRAQREDRRKTIRLRMAIWQELEAQSITTPAGIGAAIGMPGTEAQRLLIQQHRQKSDEAAAARLGCRHRVRGEGD
jgi:hypothetical protein